MKSYIFSIVMNFIAAISLFAAGANEIDNLKTSIPAVNQVKTHLFWQQYTLHEWMEKYHIQHEAWGPLAQHRLKEVIENPL